MRTWPASVRIITDELCTRIAVNNTVHVDHRHYFEHKVIQQVFGCLFLRYQKVNYAFKHETRGCLAGVLSCNDPHRPFGLVYKINVGDFEKVNFICTQSEPDIFEPDNFMQPFIFQPGVEKAAQVSQRVWNRMTKVHNIPIVHKFILKTKHVVRILTGLLPMILWLLVRNFLSLTQPTYLPFLISHHRKYCWFHAVIKQWLAFGHVHYVELYCAVFNHVPHAEKKPLCVTLCVYVILQNQIILVELFLVHTEQIPTLEVWVELKLRQVE